MSVFYRFTTLDNADAFLLEANGLTHPRAAVDEPELRVERAERTFDFCMAMIRAFFPFPVACQF